MVSNKMSTSKVYFVPLNFRPDIDPTKIFVFGRSLGGAVAVDLCSRPEYKDRVACMIIENTFTR
jgi:hypothetical protein